MNRVGVISGSFDVIHPGHIYMLEEAKKQCNYLIILLQTDPTIDRPNKDKPILSVSDRTKMMQSIKYVDEIICYDTEDELKEILDEIKPDIRFIGEDFLHQRKNNENINIEIINSHKTHKWSTNKFKNLIYESIKNNTKICPTCGKEIKYNDGDFTCQCCGHTICG